MAIAVLSGACRDKGTGNSSACAHVTNAEKYFQTFVQNHPVGGGLDSQSQIGVLDNVKSELDAGIRQDPGSDLADIMTQTIEDASQVQADIAGGKPVTTAALISDFGNLESICAELGSSDISVP